MTIALKPVRNLWQFFNEKGQIVRLDVTEASAFSTESDAIAAAVRQGFTVNDGVLDRG